MDIANYETNSSRHKVKIKSQGKSSGETVNFTLYHKFAASVDKINAKFPQF